MRSLLTLLWALPLYWLVVFPRARRELRRWNRRGSVIADPVLRRHALQKLRSERVVVEGAAAFAILAARRHRSAVICACVAFEIIYDFVDVVGEEAVADPLAHNRCLHRALVAAVEPAVPQEDYFAHFPGRHDGGYLTELVGACRYALAGLPAHDVTSAAMRRLAARAGEAQSLNHAGGRDRHRALARWAAEHAVEDATWWEFAAAASSPLGIFALVAYASDRRATALAAATIEDAYFPWVGAVVWLLESVIDWRADSVTGNHCYVANYPSRDVAGQRLVTISRRAVAALRALPRPARHIVLLGGAVSVYLSAGEARAPELCCMTRAIRRAMDGPIGLLVGVLHARRWAGEARLLRLRRAAGR